MQKLKLPTLLYGLPVKISLHRNGCAGSDPGGVISFSSENFLILFEIKLLEEIEQRNFFQVTAGTTGALSGIASPLHQEMRRLDETDIKQVWLINVSLTEIHFITDAWLELGKEHLLRFDLNGCELSLCVKINRITAVINKPIEYSCALFDVHDREEADLCRCLYQIQVIEKRRKMHMVN